MYSLYTEKIRIPTNKSEHETRNRKNQLFRARAERHIEERCLTYLVLRMNIP